MEDEKEGATNDLPPNQPTGCHANTTNRPTNRETSKAIDDDSDGDGNGTSGSGLAAKQTD